MSNHEAARKWIVKRRAELLSSMAGILGWSLVTAAIAEVLPERVVYLASAGLFLLSLFGWGFLYEIARRGLYTLTRPKR